MGRITGQVISFDFDDTLTQPGWDQENESWEPKGPNPGMIQRMREFAADGNTVIIVTSRTQALEAGLREKGQDVDTFVKEHGLPVAKVVFTDGAPKGRSLKAEGVSLHFDDWAEDLQSAIDAGVDVTKVPHPQDQVMTQRVPDDPDEARKLFSEDQLAFWEWHKRQVQGDDDAEAR